MDEVKRDELIAQARDGKIIGITFRKRDGSTRHMAGRLGVRSRLRGGEKNYSDEDKDIVTFFDVNARDKNSQQRGAYRSVRMDSVLEIKVHGRTIYKAEE